MDAGAVVNAGGGGDMADIGECSKEEIGGATPGVVGGGASFP